VQHYYEDLEVGTAFETPGVTLTEDAIIRFGLEYDFQPFHIDKIAAKASAFGGLVASGLQTLVLSVRQCNQTHLFSQAIAGLGFEKVKFHLPVPPGTTLRVRVSVTARRLSKSRPDAGIVNWHLETIDQDNRVVMSMDMGSLIKRNRAS
jgi:acyl dehydratase